MRGAGIASVFERPHSGLAFLGIVIVSLTSIVGSGFSLLSLPFALWSMLPYGILWLVGRALRDPWPALGAGTAALAADIGIRAAVFLWPRGSTAAIALVFSPAYIAAIVMPIGAGAGWLLGRMWRWHAAGRVVAIIVGPAALGLLLLWLARPELFPTTVLTRRATLERIGPPRIVSGSDSFTSVPVSTKAAWYVAHDLDGRPGEELAIVDHAGADVLDSETLAVQRHVPFGGEPGRLWGSFSTLVRLPDDRLVVAQTGGGFSRTLLKDLNGIELWDTVPIPRSHPTRCGRRISIAMAASNSTVRPLNSSRVSIPMAAKCGVVPQSSPLFLRRCLATARTRRGSSPSSTAAGCWCGMTQDDRSSSGQ